MILDKCPFCLQNCMVEWPAQTPWYIRDEARRKDPNYGLLFQCARGQAFQEKFAGHNYHTVMLAVAEVQYLEHLMFNGWPEVEIRPLPNWSMWP